MRAILWDLGDTLLDTIGPRMEALAAAYRRCLGSSTDPFALWRKDEGRTMESLGRKLLGGRYRDLIDAFNDSYGETKRRPEAYPGIPEALTRCLESGLLLAVVTSRGSWTTTEDLAASGLLHHFHSVVAFDDTDEHKREAAPLLHALDRLTIDDAHLAAFVGDSPADIISAGRAGCVAIGAAWGTLDREHLRGAAPDALAEHPGEVITLLEGMAAA